MNISNLFFSIKYLISLLNSIISFISSHAFVVTPLHFANLFRLLASLVQVVVFAWNFLSGLLLSSPHAMSILGSLDWYYPV